ncbi:MAG: S4 domain-containing protein [Gemmataceae bacterium]
MEPLITAPEPGQPIDHLAAEGRRRDALDQYLVQLFGEYSRSTVQRLIDGGGVQVNGRPAKASYKVRRRPAVDPARRADRPEPAAEERSRWRCCSRTPTWRSSTSRPTWSSTRHAATGPAPW